MGSVGLSPCDRPVCFETLDTVSVAPRSAIAPSWTSHIDFARKRIDSYRVFDPWAVAAFERGMLGSASVREFVGVGGVEHVGLQRLRAPQ